MIVRALGGEVMSNPNGSSVSKMPCDLTPGARRYFGDGPPGSPTSFSLLYHHNDAVLRMPPSSTGIETMGGCPATPVQG